MVHPFLDCLCVTPINLNTPLSFRPTIFPTQAPNDEKIVVQVKIATERGVLNYDCMHDQTVELQRGDLIQVKVDTTPLLTVDQEDGMHDWLRSVGRRFKYQL